MQGLSDSNPKARKAYDAAYAAQEADELEKTIEGYKKASEPNPKDDQIRENLKKPHSNSRK